MNTPQAQLHALSPSAPRRRTLQGARSTSQTRLSNEARAAIRLVAEAAEANTTNEVRLTQLWRDLARGLTTIVDGFFNDERCYLILRTRRDATPRAVEGRRLEILEAVLAGARQKNIAMDLKLAPSTIALNSRLALQAMGVPGKPSRAHPLLMLMSRAATFPTAPHARATAFMAENDSELHVVGIPRPDRRLSESLPTAELAVIRALVEGCSYREIAKLRGTSTRTIANQISAVFRRLRVSGRNELVQRLLRQDGVAGTSPRPNETLAPPHVASPAARQSTTRRTA